jgi:peroxiredoxin Q/BCP
MVELRKRKAAEAPAAPPLTKRPSSVKSSKGKAVATEKNKAPANGASSGSKVTIGDAIDFHDFGGEVETDEGEKTTFKKLVEDSKSGVVLFTYPKASTPGCRPTIARIPALHSVPLNYFGSSTVISRLTSNRHHSGLPF